jgi:hypothetical protein
MSLTVAYWVRVLVREANMADTIEIQSRVGDDGILDLHVPLGDLVAGADVVVTIRRAALEPAKSRLDSVEWARLMNQSYGSCAGLGLDRPPQGQFESREPVE